MGGVRSGVKACFDRDTQPLRSHEHWICVPDRLCHHLCASVSAPFVGSFSCRGIGAAAAGADGETQEYASFQVDASPVAGSARRMAWVARASRAEPNAPVRHRPGEVGFVAVDVLGHGRVGVAAKASENQALDDVCAQRIVCK